LASRVYLGTHWTSDVVGGALLGTIAALWAFEKED
jgi:membrane-associated phospholipid phosphatase